MLVSNLEFNFGIFHYWTGISAWVIGLCVTIINNDIVMPKLCCCGVWGTQKSGTYLIIARAVALLDKYIVCIQIMPIILKAFCHSAGAAPVEGTWGKTDQGTGAKWNTFRGGGGIRSGFIRSYGGVQLRGPNPGGWGVGVGRVGWGHSVRFHTGVCSSGVRTLSLF